MNFPGFYLIKNTAHSFVGNGDIKHSKDFVPIVRVAQNDDLGHFHIAQEPNGTFVIRSLVENFTGSASGYTERVITMIHHNEVGSFPNDSKHIHRWKIVRDMAHPTHFHILDVATMAYWQLLSGHAGTKVDLYYPIPEFLQNVQRAHAATTIPPGISWEIIPVLPSGRYHIKNILYGDINIGAKDDKGNTPVIAASSPAIWHVIVFMRPPKHGICLPNGATWNIYFIKPSSRSTELTSKPAADSNKEDDDSDKDSGEDSDDDDAAESSVTVVENKIVVPEVEIKGPAKYNWDAKWSANEGAWRIVDTGNSQSGYQWSLANKHQDGASDQAHVFCSNDENGCCLWELVFIGE